MTSLPGPGATPATRELTRLGVPFQVRGYCPDPQADSVGLDAARGLGVAPERVFKTLVVATDTGYAVAVVPVDRRLDLKAVAAALSTKRATMAEPAAVTRTTGYVMGGVSPFGQRRRLATIVDASAARHDTVLVSAGRRGVDVELAPDDLVTVTGAVLAAVSR